jgi:transcription elongation GreA/GreB family factor
MGAGKVSLMSPVATALIRAQARVGDEVAVHTPQGVATIEVLSVSYPGRVPLPKYGEGPERNC